MKKLLTFACVCACAFVILAEDDAVVPADDSSEVIVEPKKRAPWPAFIAFCEVPPTPDLVGLRLTIPFSTKQENVTGIDLGLWGKCLYFEGFQLNILRNDAKDYCGGIQLGLYNTVGRGDLFGIQVGLWNEAMSFRGLQAGIINVSGSSEGFQVGLINRAETLYGIQVGLINVIRDAEIPVFPLINIGF